MTIKKERKFKGNLARKFKGQFYKGSLARKFKKKTGSGIDFDDDEIEFTDSRPVKVARTTTIPTSAFAVKPSTTSVSTGFQPNVNLIEPQYRKIGNSKPKKISIKL